MGPDADLAPHVRRLVGVISAMLAAGGCDSPAAPQPMPDEATVARSAQPTAPVPSAAPAPTPEESAEVSTAPTASASAKPGTLRPQPLPPPPVVPKPKPPGWVEGRPFLVDGVARLAAITDAHGWGGDGWVGDGCVGDSLRQSSWAPPAATRPTLVEHFEQWSLAEHASVASFARFALQLMALGAPSDLVGRAIDAAADEVRHAQFGFGIASLLAGRPIGPGVIDIENAVGAVTLEEALRLAVREGMIGETIAALEAHVAHAMAEPPELKAGLGIIAEEESRHAELAYAFGAWALGRAPGLARVVEEEVAAWRPPVSPSRPGLQRWGILDGPARQRIHDGGLEHVVRPLVAQLVG